ncbi:MAG: hypothetical protein CVU65_05190 [Deltaproteobacteria bacterium HGW-Deltaproteobacteria-22]|nr:MAG: hypothetical protein CVU65_05190 [Deltaproteobacteria bacterium HGW-Deltaproteobacteria-22]
MQKPYSFMFFLFAAAFSMATLQPGVALAKKRVVLLPFDADSAKDAGKTVRGFIQDLLKNNYEYVLKKDLKEAEGAEIDFRDLTPETVKKISKQFSITAFVGAEINKVKGSYVFKTKIYNWETGEIVTPKEFTFRGKPSQKQTEEMAALILMTIEEMKEYTPPEEIKPDGPVVAQVEEKVEKVEPLTPDKNKAVKPPSAIVPNQVPAIQAGLVFGFLTRSLDFQPTTEPYYKTSAPSLAPQLKVALYPMALSGDKESLGSRFGLHLSAMFLPAFESYPANDKDNKVATTVMDINAGLLYRHPIGENIHLTPRLGYSMRTWSFAKKNVLDVPSVSYSSIDLGADVRMNLANVAVVEAGLSFYLPLGAGDLAEGEYYGESSLYGLGLRFLFGYKLTQQLEIVVTFDYSRYQFSFNDKGARSADSASDQYLQFGLGARFNH